MAYYIGVDGGGTKTTYALFDEHKTLLGQHQGGGSNHEAMRGSFDEAADVLMAGIAALLAPHGLTVADISATLMGLAGMDTPDQHTAMTAALSARGLTRVRVVNDGFIIVKAGVGARAGIGFNCGTGMCCNSIDSRGTLRQLGGLGGITGDIGGGWWAATEAYRVMYDELVLGRWHSAVTETMGLRTADDWFANTGCLGDEPFRHALIAALFGAAEVGDAPARTVVETLAARGAEFLAAHVRGGVFDEAVVPVVLSGSVHTKAAGTWYAARLGALATARCGREFAIQTLNVSPVWGCIHWLLE